MSFLLQYKVNINAFNARLAKCRQISIFAMPVAFIGKYREIRDMFHVYLNRSEFDFLCLHIIKTHKFGFAMHNERVLGKTK